MSLIQECFKDEDIKNYSVRMAEYLAVDLNETRKTRITGQQILELLDQGPRPLGKLADLYNQVSGAKKKRQEAYDYLKAETVILAATAAGQVWPLAVLAALWTAASGYKAYTAHSELKDGRNKVEALFQEKPAIVSSPAA